MRFNTSFHPTKSTFLKTLACGLVVWTAADSAEAQCMGRGAGGAGRGAQAAIGGGGPTLGQVAAFTQQQALLRQQQAQRGFAPRPMFAQQTFRQRPVATVAERSPARPPRPNLFVESAQRRREAYLRMTRERREDAQPELIAMSE